MFGRMGDHPRKIIRRVILGTVALAVVAVLLEVFGTSLQTVTADVQGKDDTLTGRTWLWQDVERLGMKHPILGSGYGAFWVPSIYDQLSLQVDNRPAEAHNGYLETFANLGLVGVGLLGWVIVQSVASASKVILTDFEYGRMRLVLLLMVLLLNYAEATFPRGTHLWWFGFLVVAVYARPWVLWPQPPRPGAKDVRAEVPPHQEAVPV
jgi:O-antigen ligase